jgi:predicted nucleic acid-binding protein
MIVVSDTSCISNLLTIGHGHFLNELFGEVIIPPAVGDELLRFHAVLPGFLKRVAPGDAALLSRLMVEIDIGEAEAICVARELHADRLLIDENHGRTVAVREGLAIIGIVGILVLAKEKSLVPSIRPLLFRLENEAGFRLSQTVKTAALKAVQETMD